MSDENLKLVASDMAQVVNVLEDVLSGNLLSLFQLAVVVQSVSHLDFGALRSDISNFNDQSRVDVESSFKAALKMKNAVVQQKILDGVGYLDQTVVLVEGLVKLGGEFKDLFLRVKALLGV